MHVHGWKPIVLFALREGRTLSEACELAGIKHRSTVWRERKIDPVFSEEYDDALEAGIDRIEAEGRRRGVLGFEEPVIDRGRLVYRQERYTTDEGEERWRMVLDDQGQPIPLTVRKYSDSLLALMLKGRRKNVFADRTEITGPDGGPQEVNVTETPLQLARKVGFVLAQGLRAAKAPPAPDLDIDDFV